LKKSYLHLAIILAFGVLLVFVHAKLYEYSFDDAYIHFRIANHLAHNGEPYFNLGEAVSASSSPAWTVILAIIIRLGQPFGIDAHLPIVIAYFNAIFTLLGAVAYTSLLAKLTQAKKLGIYHFLFFITYIAILFVPSVGLMETPAVILVIGASLNLFIEDDPRAFIGFGLAPFMRPEFAVILVLAFGYALVFRQLSFRKVILYTAIGLLPLALYNLYFFDTVIPNTLRAKSIVYDVDRDVAYYSIINSFIPNFPWFNIGAFIQYIVPVLFGLTGLVVGVRSMSMVRSRLFVTREAVNVILLGWGIAIVAAYVYFKALLFAWYIPLYAIPLVLAAFVVMAERSPRQILLGLLLLPVVASNLLMGWNTVQGGFRNPTYFPEFASGARVRHYLVVGKELREKYPNAKLMTTEIGALGYSFDGYIYDGAGLVSPAALKYHPMKLKKERTYGFTGAIPVKFVEEVNPDIIVSYDIFIEAFLKSDVKDNYDVTEYPVFLDDDFKLSGIDTLWESKHLNVFIRKGFK
jgi:hypothetical protein